ncbi:chitotriosidase-1 [Cephus cinctus]|uniref:chitinase n=1 Tax=Cephus cinctus TaxID=211228 RepID=A0AAJ7BVR3_CEPCN|nr:chitotriosidase-1 [Cephus cinctus]
MNLSVIICIMTTLLGPTLGKVIMCYFGSWATHRPGKGNFQVSDIEPSLCTHYIYAFVGVTAEGSIHLKNKRDHLPTHGEKNDIEKFAALKKRNGAVRGLVSIGGWAGTDGFYLVVNNATLRAKLVKNAVAFLEKYHLDGFDVNWDYQGQTGGVDLDKNFVELVKELKEAFVKKEFLLTAAFGTLKHHGTRVYDIPALIGNLDYLIVMSYNLTTASSSNVVEHHAPMFPASNQKPNATLMQNNVKACVDFWLKSGAPASKLVLGLPLYGKTFTLADASKTTPGSPSAGPGRAGPYTREAGSLGYNEIYEKQLSGKWTTVWDDKRKVPYAYSGDQWIGFDNRRSLAVKINYAKKHGLAGIMIWNIDTDDFRGTCGHGRYPLLNASRAALNSTAVIQEEIQEDVQDSNTP